MKIAIVLLICLCVFYLHGEEPEDDITTISELNLDQLADDNAQAVFRRFDPFEAALSSSLHLGEDAYSLSYLQVKSRAFALRGSMKRTDYQQGNLQFKYHSLLTLGYFRPAFGQGLVFAKSHDTPYLGNPPAAQSYAPLGFACKLSYKKWRGLALASSQARAVALEEGKISSMPTTKKDFLAHTIEDLGALSLWYEAANWHLGGLVYCQEYDRSFVDSEADSLIWVETFFAKASLGNHEIGLETALQKDNLALKAAWTMRSEAYWHRWRYANIGQYHRPAYAAKAMQISNLDQREEISTEFGYEPLPSLSIKAAAILNRRMGGLSDPAWLSQSSIRLAYHDSDCQISGTLKVIDREILSAVDSTYSSSIPLHYRIQLRGFQKVFQNWRIKLNARYHHQEKNAALTSGSWWQQDFCYQSPNWELSLGYAIGNSANFRMIIEDDSSLGYESIGKHSLRTDLSTSYKAGFGKIQVRWMQSLREPFYSRVMLQLALRIANQD